MKKENKRCKAKTTNKNYKCLTAHTYYGYFFWSTAS